jgi:hypothetical protein
VTAYVIMNHTVTSWHLTFSSSMGSMSYSAVTGKSVCLSVIQSLMKHSSSSVHVSIM